jgi:D-alanyl-D-alanine dipeptidase
MRAVVQALVLAALAPNAFAEAPAADAPRKLVTVVTADWAATTGALQRWQRAGKTWRAVGAPIAVVVGKSGLALPDAKREGDGASPAGRLALGDATGYDATPPRTQLRYQVATPALRCVDDPASPLYNRVAVADRGEQMRRDDELYRYTIFVRHNDARAPGRGSCIFLHVWKDASSPTVGCTAMALDDLRALLAWVDRSTLLVQLPRAEYDARQRDWGLPQRK